MTHDQHAGGTGTGRIQSIHIAPSSGAAVQELDAAILIADRGIEGDRFCATDAAKGSSSTVGQVSLIEAEPVEAFVRNAGYGFAAGDMRRNIVTRDIALNALVGKRFRVGQVTLLGVELAEPCAYLARSLIRQFGLAEVKPKQIVAALAHRGGLYASIVRGGTIKPGDAIVVDA